MQLNIIKIGPDGAVIMHVFNCIRLDVAFTIQITLFPTF